MTYISTPPNAFRSQHRTDAHHHRSFRKAGFEELAPKRSGLSCWVTGYDYGEQTQNDYLVKRALTISGTL